MRRFLFLCAGLLVAGIDARAQIPAWALHPPAADAASLGAASIAIRRADSLISVEPGGTVVTERHTVLEVLRNEGAKLAWNSETYNAAADKVLEAEAWIVRNGVEAEHRSKREWTDVSANSDGAIIDETRRIVLGFEDKAVKGDLVVFHTKVRAKAFIGDLIFDYTPSPIPRISSTIELTLPAGWTKTHHSFGPLPSPNYGNEGSVSRWALPPTPFVNDEPYSATNPSGLIISLKGAASELVTFTSWNDVGLYVNGLQVPQCDSSAELQARVKTLTASCPDDPARIRALGRYVQDLRYVAINRNLSIGHGYRPRLASEVLHMGYGDCKDKATLLRALLREIGIKSSLVAVWVADGAVIDESVPSPIWFNHAILAIELPTVPDSWKAAVVAQEGKNYLIFDPTNRLTVMGDVDGAIQGSRAFLSRDSGGTMITLPQCDGETGFSLKRRIKVHLDRTGAASCEGSIVSKGQVAASLRYWMESSGTDRDLEKLINHQMTERFRLAVIGEKSYHDDLVGGSSELDFSCKLPSFSQPIPGNQAVVKFDLFSHLQTPVFPEKERHKSIQLYPVVIQDEVSLDLEKGLEITDLPKAAELQSPYGKYSLQIVRSDSGLVVTRHYELFRQIVPVEDYAKIKQYLGNVAKADRSAAILHEVAALAP